MTADVIRQHITAVPFRPFTIHTADGRSISVQGRDFILISPLGLTIDVYQPDDSLDILDTRLITGVSHGPASGPPPVQQNQSSTP
jgi:hypothetical protein